ncbi:hypothetical protein BQ8482_310026 [Mesorhizobium delmotii]|uniref:Uncharacterized protein n=1 Tax=Mesorhizobium delmotii TaxID=1631247 RepID=A0A2P9ANK5_9HYPH|nr:hypothetical protein BQ8482_310026 [Mesorhizobium delmotii]
MIGGRIRSGSIWLRLQKSIFRRWHVFHTEKNAAQGLVKQVALLLGKTQQSC